LEFSVAHAVDKRLDLLHEPWPSDTPRLVRPLERDQFPMPPHQGVGAHDGGNAIEDLAIKAFGFGCKPSTLVVVQLLNRSTELFLQHLFFLEQVLDNVLLMVIDPA
jgi:hypothetical protein